MHKQVGLGRAGVLKIRMSYFVHFAVQTINAIGGPPEPHLMLKLIAVDALTVNRSGPVNR
jgi:hypothetical protein